MSELISKYGTYIIEPGTLLFRKAANRQFYNSMFFGFCEIGASTSNVRSNYIQVWKASMEIKSLLMLRGRQVTSEEPFLYSAIVDIYNMQFPNDRKLEYDDLALKKHDSVYRRRIIETLKRQGINTWVCSTEDNFVMELFAFGGAALHAQMFSFVESYKDLPGFERKDYRNSFNYDKVAHLPEIRKGPTPDDPFTDWLMSEN
jgi:hypothetical protein